MKNNIYIILQFVAVCFGYFLIFIIKYSINICSSRRLLSAIITRNIETRIYIFHSGCQAASTLLSLVYIEQARAPPLKKIYFK